MSDQPIVVNFEGIQHQFPSDFSQQDIQKALTQFHGTSQLPGVTSPRQPFTQSDLQSYEDSTRTHLVGDQLLSDSEYENLQKQREANPISSTIIDILRAVGEPGAGVPGGGLGIGEKVANLFKNLKYSGAGSDVLGVVSPRIRYGLRLIQKLGKLTSEASEEWEPFKPNPNTAKKMKFGGSAPPE